MSGSALHADGDIRYRELETMRARFVFLLGFYLLGFVSSGGCAGSSSSPSIARHVKIVFRGSTTRRPDLPIAADGCIAGVGLTHTHPSWRAFAAIPMTPVAPDRYEITFDDVPTDARVSFRVNDQNFCDQNPTGAATRNVFVNDVELRQNTLTPGNGDEPGYAFTISASGQVTQ
jgi:hypothetical protein